MKRQYQTVEYRDELKRYREQVGPTEGCSACQLGSAKRHHSCNFVVYIFTASHMPGSLTSHAESGDVNSIFIDANLAFDMIVQSAEFPSIAGSNWLHR